MSLGKTIKEMEVALARLKTQHAALERGETLKRSAHSNAAPATTGPASAHSEVREIQRLITQVKADAREISET